MPAHAHEAHRSVATGAAPAASGPHSQAVVAGGFVFCSGTVGLHAHTY